VVARGAASVEAREEEPMKIACPQCLVQGHVHQIEACDECGWPPALDGRCLCSYPEHRRPDGQWPDYTGYMIESLSRLYELKGLDQPGEWN
jgi:hypothetical protein